MEKCYQKKKRERIYFNRIHPLTAKRGQGTSAHLRNNFSVPNNSERVICSLVGGAKINILDIINGT